ncbi:hypothetical protein [Desertibacillus haloalkaliphilus]|uniref:hypothetical protein n=1 Tax=Desertibacillus haloalkaliphilus TaxID=1328930 RepID=UPI001C267EDC|nr:hypothetical protein [Desertibacillus haloalkaliphilus]MBU8906893.1 hypothetical protein [Desertibacillus haloalkaliphilus]
MNNQTSSRSLEHQTKLQLQQKIIHYQSEVAKYKQELKQVEKKLRLQQQQYRALEKNKSITPKPVLRESTEVTAYFTYSIVLPNIAEDEIDTFVIGNFILKNTGTTPITTPLICLKVSPIKSAKLGGKIKMSATKSATEEEMIDESISEEWVYFQSDWQQKAEETGEHWLKPTITNKLEPNETLTFPNFELTLKKPEDASAILVEGFAYSEQLKEGVTALNRIIVNY